MAKKGLTFGDLQQGWLVKIMIVENGERKEVIGWVFSIQNQSECPGIEFCYRGYGDTSLQCPEHPQNMQFINATDLKKIVKL